MEISIFGTGYVGLVSGACLAEVGHNVFCTDKDQAKIEKLNNGIVPIWEPGLEALIERNVAAGRLNFTTDVDNTVHHGEVQFIAVGTPADEDGSADLQYVLEVAEKISHNMQDYKVIVNKSTVPVGTANQTKATISQLLKQRGANIPFDVVSNPEFLKEGAAVSDFLKPDRIILGIESERARSLMYELYEPFNRNHDRIIIMDLCSAEMTKYVANAMLATKISFMNEMANLAELLGADIEEVRRGIGADPRIGHHFIYPGCGYGGSCFPKDIKALDRTAEQVGYKTELIKAIQTINDTQKTLLYSKLLAHFGGASQLDGLTIGVWGLSFKPNTDDMREAPSRTLMESLWQSGAAVRAYDPAALEEAKRIYSSQTQLKLFDDKYEALQDVDALVICTEWQQFRVPDLEEMARRMRQKVIIDGRNLYSPKKLVSAGWKYIPIGRPTIKVN
jgi:UDPglucose 6-dehydrogenase